MFRTFLFLVLLSFQSLASLREGVWRGTVQINDTTFLPFNFNVSGDSLIIHNADERIVLDVLTEGDSAFFSFPYFNSEIRCRINGSVLSGFFINHSRKDHNVLPFEAYAGEGWRFIDRPEKTSKNISGRWKMIFDKEGPESRVAAGIFRQDGNLITGTILTTTGDYRFLEGVVSGDRLFLSAFDGSHAFLFHARVVNDTVLADGHYFSGTHWHDTWIAWKDESVELPDSYSLTYLKQGPGRFSFSFPDEQNNIMSSADERFAGKVLVVQLMGSWCSNCLDESVFLTDWYKDNRHRGVEVVALDFERKPDTATAFGNIRRLKKRLGISYPVLFAGSADKEEASRVLPSLNRILAFPTTIFIDRKGVVRKIHTGFNGPATGGLYEDFKNEFNDFVDVLIAE